MAGSGVLREKKRESVQFWLAIGAVSLLFHALLIVGIKRWATIAVVEPDAVAVELVEPAGDSASAGEPIVQAAAMKPEAKSEVEPELEPEIKAEVKPEPIVQPEVKKVEPAIAPKSETKPIVKKRKSSQTSPVPSPTSQIQPSPSPEASPSPSILPTVPVQKDMSESQDRESVYVAPQSPAQLTATSKAILVVKDGSLKLSYPSTIDMPSSLKNQKTFRVLLELSVDTKAEKLTCYVSADSPPIAADKRGVQEMIKQVCENTNYVPPTFVDPPKQLGSSSSWTQMLEFQFIW